MVSERIQRQIDRLLNEAEEAVARYDWEAVRRGAQAVIAFDPNNEDALAFVAAADRALGSSEIAWDGSAAQPPTPAPPPDRQPTSFAGGRYQVKEFLGEGGKKRVRAHDSVTRALVLVSQ